jgi:hypothetical protein
MVAVMLSKVFLDSSFTVWEDIKNHHRKCGGLANSLEALRKAGDLSPD